MVISTIGGISTTEAQPERKESNSVCCQDQQVITTVIAWTTQPRQGCDAGASRDSAAAVVRCRRKRTTRRTRTRRTRRRMRRRRMRRRRRWCRRAWHCRNKRGTPKSTRREAMRGSLDHATTRRWPRRAWCRTARRRHGCQRLGHRRLARDRRRGAQGPPVTGDAAHEDQSRLTHRRVGHGAGPRDGPWSSPW